MFIYPFLLSYVTLPYRTTQIVSLQGRPTKLGALLTNPTSPAAHFFFLLGNSLSFIIPFSLVSTSPSLFPPKYPSQQMSTFSRSPSLLQIIIPKSTVGSSQSIFLRYPNNHNDQVFG